MMSPTAEPAPRAAHSGLERWARRLEAPVFPLLVVAMAALPFLFTMWPVPEGSKALYRGPILLGVLLSVAASCLRAVDTSPWPRYFAWLSVVVFALRVTFLVVIVIAALLLAAGHYGGLLDVDGYREFSSGDIRTLVYIALAETHLSVLLFLFCMMFSAPRGPERLAEGVGTYFLTGLRVILAAMFLVGLMSSFLSHDPFESFGDFRDDLGGSILAMLLLLRAVTRPRQVRILFTAACAAGLYAAIINFGWLAAFRWGGDAVRAYGIERDLIYCPDWSNHRDWMTIDDMDIRPCFPMKHHNRLANYMMMLVGIGAMLTVWPGERRRTRIVYASITTIFFVALILTRGRGAWLALMAGAVAAFALHYRPWRGWKHNAAAAGLALAIGASWMVLPASQRERIQHLFVISANPEEMSGNLLRRLHSIKTALNMREQFPHNGIGYGYHVFQEFYPHFEPPRDYSEWQASERVQPHAHVNIIQVAAEQGNYAVALFVLHILFTLAALLVATGRAVRAGSPMRHPLRAMTALVLMMQFYGLTNYSLRYSLGMFYFLTMALAAILAFSWYRDERPLGRIRSSDA